MISKKILLIGVFTTLLFGCNTEEATINEPETDTNIESSTSIPAEIIEKADQYIRSQVGDDFFASYITFNEEGSQYNTPDEYCIENPEECSLFLQKPNYLMVYSLKMPGKPYVDGIIEFAMDEAGEVITEREVSGISNCIKTPTECEFPIGKEQAITIAKEAGLEEGIKEWSVGTVHWYGGEWKTYVWTISNTLTESGPGEAAGQTVVIDANSGEVLGEILDWMSQS